ncbi:MAG: Na+/H+ antiporter subunit E [Lachnospiraceae bacterium]|nr:Na+/H+ antiporter subunit E [Lachnospiraceae bacterium]
MFLFTLFVWIIFNGRLTVEIMVFGLIISAVMYWFICKFLDYSWKIDLFAIFNIGLFVKYFGVLIAEIVKANFSVVGMVMSSRYDIEPVIVSFTTDFKTESAMIMLANSITLTPGTITVSAENNRFTVHCLDKSLAVGLNDSVFVDMLHRFEDKWEARYGGFEGIRLADKQITKN